MLATIHRAENTDDPRCLAKLFSALAMVARELPVVVPLHPRTVAILRESGKLELVQSTLRIIEPVGYFDMTQLIAGARVVATDSGGLQKEAYYASVPCVTLRGETEWVELVAEGYNVLAPPSADASVLAAAILAGAARTERKFSRNLYGAGQAAERIVFHLRDYLKC